MGDMFYGYNNLPADYVPDNKTSCTTDPRLVAKDTIVRGETTTHTFRVPFNVETDVKSTGSIYSIYINYKQGLTTVLTKAEGDISVEVVVSPFVTYSYVSCILSPADTLLFNDYNKDTEVQLKVILKNNDIIYSQTYTIVVLPTVAEATAAISSLDRLLQERIDDLQTQIDNNVPNTRQINGHALSADVTITKTDILGTYGGTQVTDLNAITSSGFYTCLGTATGVPSSTESWYITHVNSHIDTTSATQEAVGFSTGQIWKRVKKASVWSAWFAVVVEIQSLTWSALKALCDSSLLTPGKSYRITDYVCTTVQENTHSAGHPFDIIVVADTVNKLNERARAVRHEGDTYFASSKLEAWQVWYSLDNDTNRFAWADTANGKGVIYRMIDEFNNDCPYDFKNMMFLVSGEYFYTFHYTEEHEGHEGEEYDLSLNQRTMFDFMSDEYTTTEIGCHTNIIRSYYNQTDGSDLGYGRLQFLNFITFRNTAEDDGGEGLKTHCCYSNFFDFGCRDISFRKCCSLNSFGCDCRHITIGKDSNYNRFEKNNQSITLGDNCNNNTFGDGCYSNTFGNSCGSNAFGNTCYSNAFGAGCCFNAFGNNCSANAFGSGCFSNTFGNSCSSNAFGNTCYSNAFGNSCGSNAFGNTCYSNTFGNECAFNAFGNNCHSNTFGSDCLFNKITGESVKYISVDNGISGASFANKLELYDSAIVSKAYQISFKKASSGRYLMLWATDTGTMTGKYKAAATDVSWTAL